ncbi:hypothetical protein EBH_0030450 [Eimeria brunetti]|uniref:Uncharacterized protein n=1 Tax=Eimeria brunetti TaxID=51314 RepID=U6LI51_9EIME|nr:hypothetical protein EBH_0030450 [Eimeria brunetti]
MPPAVTIMERIEEQLSCATREGRRLLDERQERPAKCETGDAPFRFMSIVDGAVLDVKWGRRIFSRECICLMNEKGAQQSVELMMKVPPAVTIMERIEEQLSCATREGRQLFDERQGRPAKCENDDAALCLVPLVDGAVLDVK